MELKSFNLIGRRTFILAIVFLVVVIFLFWENSILGDRFISLLSKVNFLRAGLLLNISQNNTDTGIDFSNFNPENLVSSPKIEITSDQEEAIIPFEGIAEVSVAKQMSLIEIKEKLSEVELETERVKRDVEKLSILMDIEKEISQVSKRIEAIVLELNLKTLSQKS
ncbi:MAG: hypothetical protein PHI53_01560 [Candidatus Pacebacteria bacterium]|nr:hypothetical protein [Candidatus Paceibacterota bacterium]